MNCERTLIAAVAFLVFGLGLIFAYCHGTVGLSAAVPVASAGLDIAINTKGLPAVAGVGGTLLGLVLLLVSVVQAIVGQVHWPGDKAKATIAVK